ncbi:MAG TPA: GAF domain-containing SpoIIE family protein phosphatase, partial [Planctomycetaceae bacterium]
QPADWIRHRLTGLTKLMEITQRLAAQTELGPILEIITQGACQALECERASLFLYDEKRRELFTRVATDLELQEIRSSIDAGFNGWVGRHKQPLNISNPASDERWNSAIDLQTGFHTRNVLAAPLVSPRDGRLLGTLELINKKSGQSFDQGDENLLLAFAAHAAVSLERIELLENFRQSRELEVSVEAARKLQVGFLPQRLPKIAGYELAAWWQPALGVAGDYYDVVRLPDERLAIAVADVSGHGLGPSLIMASARAMLHVLARTSSYPARILTLLNETITPDLKMGRFITFLLGALDIRTHTLSFANAGHGPAFHLQRRAGLVRQLEATAVPIGITADPIGESAQPVVFEPGDLVILATDGAIEQRNAEGEMFGRERFEQIVREHQQLPAHELVPLLKEEISGFYRGTHPDDDVTILILERKNA